MTKRDWRRVLFAVPSAGEDHVAAAVAALRRELQASDERISILDFKSANRENGGTALLPSTRLEIALGRLVDSAAVDDWSGRILYRLARWARARRAVEIGTSLGISACWIAAALAEEGEPELLCLDGAVELLDAARGHIVRVAGFEPTVQVGPFAETVPAMAAKLRDLDFAFVDGEHFYEPTMRDAHHVLPRLRTGGVFVLHDIAWNSEMRRAWRHLAQHPLAQEAVEPRHHGSRDLGVVLCGRRADGGRIIPVEDGCGPAAAWSLARHLVHLRQRL